MAITFDGAERLITLTSGTVELDVIDLYSRWKDYVKTSDGGKYAPAFAPLGGDDIDPVAGTTVPLYAFLVNGWRIKPQEASHTLTVTAGILLVSGGGDPFIDTTGSFMVRVNYQQPVQAITVESGTSGLTPTESAQLGVIQEVEDKVDIIDTNVDAILVDTGSIEDKVDIIDTNVDAILADTSSIEGKVDVVDANVDTALASLASVSSRLPAALSGGKMDSTLSSSERDAVAAALLDLAARVETGMTLRQALRILTAVLAGKSSGFPDSPVFRDVNDTKPRVTATLDDDGNRTAVTLDAT